MSEDFKVTGANDFLRLSKALKAAGEKELRAALNKGLRDAAKPLIEDVREAAQRELPHSGGLAALVSGGKFRVQVRTGARTAGVRITGSGQALSGADKGLIRHPVFGNRAVFVEQRVDGGWFSDTLNEKAPGVRPALEAALEDVAKQIVDRAK